MDRISFIILFSCLLGMVASYPNNRENTKKKSLGSSLVHLMRSKRFDFSMFACADCQPYAYCRHDADCHNGYTCEFKCCSFKCVRELPSFRGYGNFRDGFQKNGQADVANERSEELNNVDIDVNNQEEVIETTDVPARDVPDTLYEMEAEDNNSRRTEN